MLISILLQTVAAFAFRNKMAKGVFYFIEPAVLLKMYSNTFREIGMAAHNDSKQDLKINYSLDC